LAFTKQRKEEIVSQYVDWIDSSQAVVLTAYTGLSMKDIDELRGKIREAGGEFHIVKNTLGKVAIEQVGLELPDDLLVGSTAAAFAFEDAPGVAKAVADFAKESDFLNIKAGYLDGELIGVDEVKSLAELPPLPVMRAQLLGVLSAPAGKLVRTLAEPARGLASVLQAFADADGDAAPAAA
jgi:large subunit ribosomal protein L10